MKRVGIACALALSLCGCGLEGSGSRGTTPPQINLRDLPSDIVAPPEVISAHGVATVELAAVINSTTGLPAFLYEGGLVAPTIRVKPGDTIVVDLDDELPAGKGMGSDVNLHFHGLSTSPMRPADDVLTMLAKPGKALYYSVPVPATQPPGLYWYHPHVHGQTNYQVGEGGMSGAIVVEGIAAHLPALAKMPEHILIVRQLGSAGGEGAFPVMRSSAAPVPPVRNVPCAPEPAGVFLSVNSRLRPTIRINPGQPEFFRVLNATGHRHLDLSLGGIPMQIVAIDGYPLDTYPGEPASLTQTHVVVPPAGRVEFVATGAAPTELRTLCYDSGPIGDADPAEDLAHLRPDDGASIVKGVRKAALQSLRIGAPLARGGASEPLPPPAATRVVRFSEDAKGFYINGQAYSPSAPPMFVVRTGTVERWRIENLASEVHDFHLHQVHFRIETIDGIADPHPLWRDTVVVPHRTQRPDGSWKPGTVTMIADFRSKLIRGTFLFHCHILDHEDAGMMAKIQAF